MRVIKQIEWNKLQPVWNTLIDKNPMETPFQSYDYLTFTGKGKPHYRDTFRTVGLRELNLVLYTNDVPIAIAPLLYKTKNGKTSVYLRGHFTAANHLDFIYASMSYDDFAFLMDGIRELLGEVFFEFDRIYYQSPTCEYLKQYLPAAEVHAHECYAVPIPNQYEDWFNSLSKSRRTKYNQIRNRIAKDNIQCKVLFFHSETIDPAIYKAMISVYVDRHIGKNNFRFGPFTFLVKKILHILLMRDKMSQWLNHADNNFHVIVCMNNEIAAFASGLIGNDKRMLGNRLAMNAKFKRYTPGAVLFSSMMRYLIEQRDAGKTDIGVLDMGQGGHGGMSYKSTFGGELYYNYSFIE